MTATKPGAHAMQVREKAAQEVSTVTDLLNLAVEKNVGTEGLEKLVELYWRQQDRLAAQEFADALAAFQEECPPIPKSSKADIATKGGARYSYRYAGLDEIAKTVRPLLHKHGLSYSWDSQTDEKQMHVTCTLRHRNGHRESALFTLPIANPMVGTNDQQKQGAALTYGRRQSLIQALGLTTTDPDTDGQAPDAPINQDQAIQLKDALDELNQLGVKWSRLKLFEMLDVPATKFEELPAMLFPTAMNLLRMKIEQARKEKKA